MITKEAIPKLKSGVTFLKIEDRALKNVKTTDAYRVYF